MNKYKVGYIFYDDEDYSNKAQFCNENNLMIVEIKPDNIGRRFKIVKNELSQNEINEIEIKKLKEQLKSSDYKAIKFAEGLIGNKEYEQIKAERQSLRDKINQLKKDIN